VTAPCPTCSLTGGFHDVHRAHEVPAELLQSGDRHDAWLMERMRIEEPFAYAFAMQVQDRFIAAMLGQGTTQPSGVFGSAVVEESLPDNRIVVIGRKQEPNESFEDWVRASCRVIEVAE